MKTITASTRVDVDTPIVNLNASAIIAWKWTGSTWIVLKNLKFSPASELSWTALNVEIDISGTPYYFAIYPTKA
jgi:hypothetical protein